MVTPILHVQTNHTVSKIMPQLSSRTVSMPEHVIYLNSFLILIFNSCTKILIELLMHHHSVLVNKLQQPATLTNKSLWEHVLV